MELLHLYIQLDRIYNAQINPFLIHYIEALYLNCLLNNFEKEYY